MKTLSKKQQQEIYQQFESGILFVIKDTSTLSTKEIDSISSMQKISDADKWLIYIITSSGQGLYLQNLDLDEFELISYLKVTNYAE